MHNGIARHGRIIVGVWFPTPTEFHAYEVEEGDYQLLDIPNSISSDARDVNPSGEIVGFFTDSANKTHGFLLRKGDSLHRLSRADVVSTQARGINPQGDIVGFYVSKDASGYPTRTDLSQPETRTKTKTSKGNPHGPELCSFIRAAD